MAIQLEGEAGVGGEVVGDDLGELVAEVGQLLVADAGDLSGGLRGWWGSRGPSGGGRRRRG